MTDTVLVTGVSGFVGLAVATEALQSGFRVRATIRKPAQERAVRELLAEVEGAHHLEFVTADLLSDAGWAEVMTGCTYVIHTASPLILGKVSDEQELLAPAVDGTLRVLEAALESGVSRVVITSTALTACGHVTDRAAGPGDYTPSGHPGVTLYTKSKILAEEAVRAFAAEHPSGPAITTIHPGVIIGPPLRVDEDSESIELFRGILTGARPAVPAIGFPMADVRDVARIHVAAMQAPDSENHRYLVSFAEYPQQLIDIAGILRANGYPKAPRRTIPMGVLRVLSLFNSQIAGLVHSVRGSSMRLDTSNTRSDFGWTPISVETSVLDTAHALTA